MVMCTGIYSLTCKLEFEYSLLTLNFILYARAFWCASQDLFLFKHLCSYSLDWMSGSVFTCFNLHCIYGILKHCTLKEVKFIFMHFFQIWEQNRLFELALHCCYVYRCIHKPASLSFNHSLTALYFVCMQLLFHKFCSLLILWSLNWIKWIIFT
jgi:hypothetical protein